MIRRPSPPPVHQPRRVARVWGGFAALFSVALVMATGCDEDEIEIPRPVCDPAVRTLSPVEGALGGGTELRLSGLFLDAPWGDRDVTVLIGGAEAVVEDVGSAGCDACEACGLTALRCAECDRVCEGEVPYVDDLGVEWEASRCEAYIVVRTPAATAPGPAPVVVLNVHGSTVAPDFEYVEKTTPSPGWLTP